MVGPQPTAEELSTEGIPQPRQKIQVDGELIQKYYRLTREQLFTSL